MFAPFALLFSLLAFVAETSAVPVLSSRDNSTCSSSGAQCNTGTVSCCETTYPVSSYFLIFVGLSYTSKQANSSVLTNITSTLNIQLGPADGSFGMGCSPLGAIGPGSGAMCVAEPVCCSGNTYVSFFLLSPPTLTFKLLFSMASLTSDARRLTFTCNLR